MIFHNVDEIIDIINKTSRNGVFLLPSTSIVIKNNKTYRNICRKGARCVACGGVPLHITYKRNEEGSGYIEFSLENKRILTIDHIIPRCKGGSSEFHNLQVMCDKCNRQKGSKVPSYTTSYYFRRSIDRIITHNNVKSRELNNFRQTYLLSKNIKKREIELNEYDVMILSKELFFKFGLIIQRKAWVKTQPSSQHKTVPN